MTISLSEIIPDNGRDLIGAKLKKIKCIPKWNGKKQKLRDELVKILKFHNYKSCDVKSRNYKLYHVGDSFLYDVPEKKNGHLKEFRGKRIRLICVFSGRYTVWIRVGIVRQP
jgi:hypothetical protein